MKRHSLGSPWLITSTRQTRKEICMSKKKLPKKKHVRVSCGLITLRGERNGSIFHPRDLSGT